MTNKTNISVVIPCRNEAPFIKECLEAIFNSELTEEVVLNVYVVDGMSDDGTRGVVKEYALKNPAVLLVDNTKQLTPYAFNLGINQKKSDYVQIIGARHIVSTNYIQNSFLRLKNNPSDWCVGGRLENVYLNVTGEIIAKAMGTPFGMGLGNFRTLTKSGYTDTVTSPMYPYSVFEKIGLFDEQLIRNQDDDFNYRVTNAGGKIYFDNSIFLKYYVRGNLKGLWRQFFQYGYWKVFVNKKHKAVTTLRQLIPPLFIIFTLLTPIALQFPLISNLWLSIWLVYSILLLYYSAKLSTGLKQFLKLILSFLVLHFSYGLGYIKGIFEFLILNKKPSEKQTRLSR